MLQSEIESGAGHFPHISPFATAQDAYRLLQIAGFTFVITDVQKIELEYDSPLSCMKELQRMGESSNLIHGGKPLAKDVLQNLKSGSFVDHVEIITVIASKTNVNLCRLSLPDT